LNSKINEFYLELGVLTKNVTVMLLIVLAEAALRWNYWLLRCLFLTKKGKQLFYNFWHSGDKSDFLLILHKMQNITIIYERNACQVRLWMVRGLVSQIDPKKELNFLTTLIIVLLKEQTTEYIHGKLLRPSQAKTIRSITVTYLVSTSNSK
jgi:hypothetical protein